MLNSSVVKFALKIRLAGQAGPERFKALVTRILPK